MLDSKIERSLVKNEQVIMRLVGKQLSDGIEVDAKIKLLGDEGTYSAVVSKITS